MKTFEEIVYAVSKRISPLNANAYKRAAHAVTTGKSMRVESGYRDWMIEFTKEEGWVHIEFHQRNADGYYEWNSLMDIEEGFVFVYESGLDTFGGGPSDQVIIYRGTDLAEGIKKMLQYRPVQYGWVVGDPTGCNYDTYATRRKGAKKVLLKRV